MALDTDRDLIKKKFQNGDKPDEGDFTINLVDDGIEVEDSKVGIGTTGGPKGYLHVYDSRSDAVGAGKTTPTLMLGNDNGLNLSFDTNEIAAKNNGGIASFHLQREGGDVRVFNSDVDNTIIMKDTGKLGIGNENPSGRIHVSGTDHDFVVKEDGKVGIDTTDPQARLHVYTTNDQVTEDGTGAALMIGKSDSLNLSFDNNEIMAKNGDAKTSLYLNGVGGSVVVGGSMIYSSDRTLKKEIKPLTKGVQELLKLKPVSFKWKKDAADDQDLKFGFIAQDVEKVLKDVTYLNEKTGKMGLSISELVPVLVRSIQEQQNIIDKLTSRVDAMERKNAKK